MIEKYGLLVFRGGRLLVNRKKESKLFLLPGGKPEEGESPEQCIRREMQEEHGVAVSNLRYFGDFSDKAANEDDMLCMHVYTGEIIGEPQPGAEITEQRWFAKDDDWRLLSPIIRNRLLPELLKKKLL